ncbi:MAG: hypothetical protein SPI53_05880 [Erysipelotrichaceae bacterium]|nr:hypothetical protein [Erysipelotrichaceae bacterium]
MNKLDIKDLDKLNERLSKLQAGELLVLSDGVEEKFVLIDSNTFDMMQKAFDLDVKNNPLKYFDPSKLEVRVISDPSKPELSEEEYEAIKKQLNEALEKTLKPSHKYKLSQS